jgi:hypothetical protein
MGWRDVAPSEGVEVADWIRESLHPFAQDVGSVVAPGFAAYARVFHPASLMRKSLDDPEIEVRWSEIAAWNGKVVHPEMQFHRLGGPWQGHPQEGGLAVYEPRLGVLTPTAARALVGILNRHTSTPESCWFCLWEGYGDLHPGGVAVLRAFAAGPAKTEPPAAPPPIYPPQHKRVNLPGRAYLLFHGSVRDGQAWDEGPNLWWPADRHWCVASEIDLPCTYVGGSTELINEVLSHPEIEALPAAITHGITASSDSINS